MKFPGFIGPAYTLDSVNVDAQRAVNIYPEIIESNAGKESQVAYYKNTPGLMPSITAGVGPIRCLHIDSIGRKWVVSGNKIMRLTNRGEREMVVSRIANSITNAIFNPGTNIDTTTDTIEDNAHERETGDKVTFTTDGTLPGGLSLLTDYYVIKVADDERQYASSLANALAGTQIDITSTGTGTLNEVPSAAGAPLFSDSEKLNLNTSVNYNTGVITSADHGLYTGLRVWVSTLGCPLPSPLANDIDYFVIRIDDDNYKLASSLTNAASGTGISLTETTSSHAIVQINVSESPSTNSDGDYIRVPATFDTSTGIVKAVSMSTLGDGTDSTTMFTDGLKSYIIYLDGVLLNTVFTDSYDDGAVVFPIGPASTHVTWIDGYFTINKVGTNKFFVSGLQDFKIDTLSFSSSEGSPDIVLGLESSNRFLYLFNELTTEVYYNSGNADFPFERIQGGFVQMGCLAKYSICKVEGSIMWLGRSESGQGVIFQINGTSLKRISTHAIEQAISGYADASTATAYSYHSEGHIFYVINFAEATWVYDVITGLWHERAYTNDAGTLERHRADVHLYDFKNGIHFMGDYENGKVYQLSDTTYQDDGQEITRLRTCPHISKENKRIFYSKLFLDMETGVGLNGDVLGSEPLVMMSYSDDGGHTWSDELTASIDVNMGAIGDYKKRMIWRRLGSSRDRIFRFKVTDPVKTIFINADLDFLIGRS